jgi:lipoate-protein ligase A
MLQEMNSWRCVVDAPKDAFTNMALDEAMLLHCIEGKSPPTLRFYQWERPCISFGYAVDAEAELNLPLCREHRVPVVRRITGGGVVFHKCDITYAVVFPDDFAGGKRQGPGKKLSVLDSYRLINRPLAEGFKQLGVVTSLLDRKAGGSSRSQQQQNVCFSNPTIYDILHDGRKLAGSAQRRKKGWVLHHGSILYSSDFVKMCPLVGACDAESSGSSPGAETEMVSSMDNPMARTAVCLEEVLGARAERNRVVAVLSESFARALGIKTRRSPLTPSEKEMAAHLRKHKYATEDWNLRRTASWEARVFG